MTLSRSVFSIFLLVLAGLGLSGCATSARYVDEISQSLDGVGQSIKGVFSSEVPSILEGPSRLVTDLEAQGMPPKLLMTADIGECGPDRKPKPAVFATAELLEDRPGLILIAGDIAYPDGRATDFSECFDPAYGSLKKRTLPATGNHEYHEKGANSYYQYFGAQAGKPDQGWYSVNFSGWHIVALNSNLPADEASAQWNWLKNDLAKRPQGCLLAFWHHPRFSSGGHGNNMNMDPAWQLLAKSGADVILNGHDHHYERFAPQNAIGEKDENGTREFVVGTGGAQIYEPTKLKTNSEVRNGQTYGILELDLRKDGYAWRFLGTSGAEFEDRGVGQCHQAFR